MLCQPSSRRQTLRRRLARTRAGGVKSCADSKPNRSCKPRRHASCSLGKSRTEHNASITKFSVRYPRTNQYSITALTDALGSIVERYAYDAYGGLSVFDGSGTARTSTAEANRYTYTGREWDEDLDLYHYRARMYDPVAGRFLGRDPMGFIDGNSRYRAYFILSLTDPLGLKVGGGITAQDLLDDLCAAAGKTKPPPGGGKGGGGGGKPGGGVRPRPVGPFLGCLTKICSMTAATVYVSQANDATLNAAAADLAGRVNRGEITREQAAAILRAVAETNAISRDCRSIRVKMRQTCEFVDTCVDITCKYGDSNGSGSGGNGGDNKPKPAPVLVPMPITSPPTNWPPTVNDPPGGDDMSEDDCMEMVYGCVGRNLDCISCLTICRREGFWPTDKCPPLEKK